MLFAQFMKVRMTELSFNTILFILLWLFDFHSHSTDLIFPALFYFFEFLFQLSDFLHKCAER